MRIVWRLSRSPETIWEAWTDPRIMKRWFGSDPNGIVLAASADVRLGGAFEVTFANSDGSRYTCHGEYREISKPGRLAFTWGWKDRPGVTEMVTLEIERGDSVTTMRFEHSNIDPNTTHDYEEGWKRTFEKLDRALDESARGVL